jgi:hypothetical protein
MVVFRAPAWMSTAMIASSGGAFPPSRASTWRVAELPTETPN